jgi:glycosyltransferase involved in cell wall biosynthesis
LVFAFGRLNSQSEDLLPSSTLLQFCESGECTNPTGQSSLSSVERFNDRQSGARGFTIGICASGSATNLSSLLKLIDGETFPDSHVLQRIIIVASSCSRSALDAVNSMALKRSNVMLINEAKRNGKADAINKIIQNSVGAYLVFVNSDALPQRGAIAKLLTAIEKSESTGIVSGKPIFAHRSDPTSVAEEFMWEVHNECSLKLNHLNMSNHVSDEMIAIRMEALERLPTGLVNDGAYIAGRAKLNGYSIKFCSDANVSIDVPRKAIDLIRQRRRIIFGHLQVWKLTGKSPKTIESMLLYSPALSLSLVVGTLAKKPRLIAALPVAIVSEIASVFLGILDTAVSSKKHGVWTRYDN